MKRVLENLAWLAFILFSPFVGLGGGWFLASYSTLAAPAPRSGIAAPAYTDPNVATTNGVGGVGNSVGWKVVAPVNGIDDAMSYDSGSGNVPATIASWFATTQMIPALRTYVVTRIKDDGTDANEAVCVDVGTPPNGAATPYPFTSCPDVSTVVGYASGCYLTATNQSCTFTIRPPTSCTNYLPDAAPTWTNCHVPLWIGASGGAANTTMVHVGVVW